MRTCWPSIVLSLPFFVVLLNVAVAALVKTVVVDEFACGKSFIVHDKVHTYRVMMPDQPACSLSNTSNFDCEVKFYFPGREPYAERCVDFSRLRLAGESTSFSISVNDGLNGKRVEILHSNWHLLTTTSVRCYHRHNDPLVLRFRSDCNDNLRNYFGSWLYVYSQPDRLRQIYHLDGTCNHSAIIDWDKQLTIRSYIWNDTANESNNQICSLLIRIFVYSAYGIVLCPSWTIRNTSCQLSIYLQDLSLGYNGLKPRVLKNATCHSGFHSTLLETCLPFGFLNNVLLSVQRDINVTETRPIEDGALFFEAKMKIQVVDTKFNEADDSTQTPKPEIESDWESVDVDTILRVVSPFAIIVFLSICFCNHRGRKIMNSLGQRRGNNPAAADASTGRVAMQPLMDGSACTAFHPTGQYLSQEPNQQAAQADSMNAPPPPYSEVISADYAAPATPPVAPPSYDELYGQNST